MSSVNLKELFDFCQDKQDKLGNFEVRPCDESEHYYLDNQMIGGYAGDVREYFSEPSEELSFAIKTFELAKRLDPEYNGSEVENEVKKHENRIDLTVRTRDRGLGLEITSVTSSKSLGYQDGPEDPEYDLMHVHNLKDVEEQLSEMYDIFCDFPKNPTFYIDGEKFAVQERRDIKISESFPKELYEKYNRKEIKGLSTANNEDGTFSIVKRDSPSRTFPFLAEPKEHRYDRPVSIKFATKVDAIEALKVNLKGESIILDGKPFGENLKVSSENKKTFKK
jgi:hypothetical protein